MTTTTTTKTTLGEAVEATIAVATTTATTTARARTAGRGRHEVDPLEHGGRRPGGSIPRRRGQERRRGADGSRDRVELLDPALGEAKARHGGLHRSQRLRRRPRLLASRRRQDLEDPCPRQRPEREPHRNPQAGRPLHLLVRGRLAQLEGHARQLRAPLTPAPAAPRTPRRGAAGHTSAMAHTKRTILLVEDEESITTPLTAALERDGFQAEVAHTVAEGLELGRRLRPDLVLLDLMLPDGSGLDVCRELRASSSVPIIILSARGDEADRVVGLELGADDYVVKPFSAREVIARVRAVLRRTATGALPRRATVEVGEVRLDPAKREVTLRGEVLELSRKEFELLHLLMRNAGSVVTREQLIDEVWAPNWFGSTKTLDVHVSGIRRKLDDDAAEPRYLHTIRGVGFRFSSPDELE